MRPSHLNLYQLNTRLYLSDLSQSLGRPANLADVPDAEIDRLSKLGFDWVWLLGVWQTGEVGLNIARKHPEVRRELRHVLPDLQVKDIVSSPFAIQSYCAHADFGGPSALAKLRLKLARRGLRLMLDFVPNHVAIDHPWVRAHADYFVHGNEKDLAAQPLNYVRVGDQILAHGRDLYFCGWIDTLQLDYGNPDLRQAMCETLTDVARTCDGVRCDMAMLMLNDVFQRTWARKSMPPDEFWPRAIAAARRASPDFAFAAEVYWGRDGDILRQGFDYAYDKSLYDGLVYMDAPGVVRRLAADGKVAYSLVRFLENHDEPRASAVFTHDHLRAAAVIAFLCPGLLLVHEGQMEGRRLRSPMQLGRRPQEPPDAELRGFYERLLAVTRRPEVYEGRWQPLAALPAWQDNPTWHRFVLMRWGSPGREVIVAVNFGPERGQCLCRLPVEVYAGRAWTLQDLMGPEKYERDGDEMSARGLYLDIPPWGFNVFAVEPRSK